MSKDIKNYIKNVFRTHCLENISCDIYNNTHLFQNITNHNHNLPLPYKYYVRYEHSLIKLSLKSDGQNKSGVHIKSADQAEKNLVQ